MTWSYSGRPGDRPRDEVRFLAGDTDEREPLVQDEEIDYALAEFPAPRLAAALCLRALASRYARQASVRVGDIQLTGGGQITGAFKKRADELDPGRVTAGATLALAKFGGEYYSEKQAFDSDSDAVPPSFRRGLDDIPGGPDDVADDSTDRDWID